MTGRNDVPDPTIPPPLTTYAQNFEDVLLWRALREVEGGFYIDIGAQDPVIDSVSLAFYEHGWRGIHVEPNGHYADKLRAARPDEEVVQAAISATPGLIDFYEIEGSGLSTADAAQAERHRQDGYPVRRSSVPTLRLADLFDKVAGREIHWLKIDVEGLERQVIESWGEHSARPWVLVIESTLPRTQISSADWEPLVLARGYRLVHEDGLNRFYLSDARADLAQRFAFGPNTFDDFVLAETNYFARPLAGEIGSLRARLAEKTGYCEALEKGRADDRIYIGHLEEALAGARRELHEAWQTGRLEREAMEAERAAIDGERAAIESERAAFAGERAELGRTIETLQRHIAEMEGSRSWRVTRPLRQVGRLVRRLAGSAS